MTRDQNSIIWLGLILIALNLVINIDAIKSVLFGTPEGDSSSTTASTKTTTNPVNSSTATNTPTEITV